MDQLRKRIRQRSWNANKQAKPCEDGLEVRTTRSVVNGFYAAPEPQSIVCEEARIAPYSLPCETLAFVPPPELAVVRFENGDSERHIHCNVELQPEEQDRLQALQREARQQGLAFFPSVSAAATRFLSHARMSTHRALKLMLATQEWRRAYFRDGPVSDAAVAEDLRHGIAYFCGRDRALRPVLVVRGRRIPQCWYKCRRVDKLIRLLVFTLEYMLRYMLVPGRVETLCVIVDLRGVSLSQVSLSALSEVYKVMSNHYTGRVSKFLICNMPSALSMVAAAAKGLLTDRQRHKLRVLHDVAELQQEIAPDQLERDLGGTRGPISEFLPFPLAEGPLRWLPADGVVAVEPIPDAHQILTAEGAMGNLWDPSLSYEENVALDYGPRALGLLTHCRREARASELGEEDSGRPPPQKQSSGGHFDEEQDVLASTHLTSLSMLQDNFSTDEDRCRDGVRSDGACVDADEVAMGCTFFPASMGWRACWG